MRNLINIVCFVLFIMKSKKWSGMSMLENSWNGAKLLEGGVHHKMLSTSGGTMSIKVTSIIDIENRSNIDYRHRK